MPAAIDGVSLHKSPQRENRIFLMDSLVERIGRIPFRLTVQAFSRPSNGTALTRHFDRIRTTFRKHTPSIVIGDHIGTGGFADVFKATSSYDGVIIGSQFYMSPEQIYNPENLDQRTDIYSFGVVCYELLYGVHPKSINKNATNVLLKLAREKPIVRTPPRGFEELNEIVMKCMGGIRERYQSMEHVVTDLRTFYERAGG